MKLSKRQKRNARKFSNRMAALAEQRKADREAGQLVNTRAFWQRQSFGPASEVRRIDPATVSIDPPVKT